jgi:selenocysteine lyase/cysteine desulfurase
VAANTNGTLEVTDALGNRSVQDIAAVAQAQFGSLSRICFNAARWHPLPHIAQEAAQRHLAFRAADGGWGDDPGLSAQQGAKLAFAKLIGAGDDEVALVPSTIVAEQRVVRALSLPEQGAIATDLLHFDASIYAYDQLIERGAEVRVVQPKHGKIDLDDYRAILSDGRVRLVAVSAISNVTGFAHDLKALAKIAHDHGALLYADVIQLAGAAPFNVAETGVDFCAASGFKWLMGEMGLGFLYVRRKLLPSLSRPTHGYRQLLSDIEPWPPSGGRAWHIARGVAGYFESGSLPVGAAVSLEASIGLINALGVEKIVGYRTPLLERIKAEMPKLGFPLITPNGSNAPFACFDITNRPRLHAALRHANINAGILGPVLRVSVSVFNTDAQIDALLHAAHGSAA